MELTKDAIVQRVQDWYNADRLVGAVNIDLKRKHHVQGMPRLDWFAETLRSTADAEAVRKLQLIWEQLCFAPELWTHDGKMDVRILAGWSPFVLQDMFGIKSVYVQRKTEGAILDRSHHGIKLIPLLIYLNMCSTVKSAPCVAKQTLPFDHASDDTLFVYVRNNIAGAAFGFVGTDRMCEPHFHTQLDYTPRAAAYQQTCRGLWTEMDRILQGDGTMQSAMQSAMQLANRSQSRGLVAATIYWMLCDPRNTAQDVREMVGRFITMARGEVAPWCSPFDMSNVQIPSRPVLATTDGGLVKGFAPLFDENAPVPVIQITGEITKDKHDLRFTVRDSAGEGGVNEVGYVDGSLKIDEAPFGYDAVDNEAALNGTAATYEMPAEHPYTGAVPILRGEHTLPAGVPVSYEPTTRVEKELSDENNWTPAAPLPDISAMKLQGATLVDVLSVLLQSEDIYGSLTAAIADESISRWHVKSVMMATAMWLGDSMRFVESDEGDPLRDVVAAWLAETLRPRTITWISDPISDVLAAAIEGTAWHDKTPAALVKQAATLLSTLHAYNKGRVQVSVGQTETTAERGFREALHRLVDASADPDPKVFAYVLLTEFGERLRLSNKVPHFRGVVERDTLAHVDSSGRHSVLWASTGDFIYRAVPSLGRELIDWQHPDNVAHLQACYNAHNTPLGDTHPCSHFTSRPH